MTKHNKAFTTLVSQILYSISFFSLQMYSLLFMRCVKNDFSSQSRKMHKELVFCRLYLILTLETELFEKQWDRWMSYMQIWSFWTACRKTKITLEGLWKGSSGWWPVMHDVLLHHGDLELKNRLLWGSAIIYVR